MFKRANASAAPEAVITPATEVSTATQNSTSNPLSPHLESVVGNRVEDGEQEHDPLTEEGSQTSKERTLRRVAQRLRNVFAAPMSFVSGRLVQDFPKSDAEAHFLFINLQKNYLFAHLVEKELMALVAAFEKMEVPFADHGIVSDSSGFSSSSIPIICQGEMIDDSSAYFYVLYEGKCSYGMDGNVVGWAHPGDSFGELALLYDCPRMATVSAVFEERDELSPAVPRSSSTAAAFTAALVDEEHTHDVPHVILFRVHQQNFRRVLHQAGESSDTAKLKLLETVSFLKDANEHQKIKLAAVMVAKPFHKGEYLVTKGETECAWYLLERGIVKAHNITLPPTHDDIAFDKDSHVVHSAARRNYQDITLDAGECFGERSIITGDAAIADAIAESAGVAFTVNRETFLEVLGNFNDMVLRASDEHKLKAIPLLADTTQSDSKILNFLANQIVDESYPPGTVLATEGKPLSRAAALYLVRKGTIEISSVNERENIYVSSDGYFGSRQLLKDTFECAEFVSPYTATVREECTCGILKLSVCRRVLDTHNMGKPQSIREIDSIRVKGDDGKVTLRDLKLYRILGAGTFGQTWLVSRTASDGSERSYALKVQAKYDICQKKQAKSVVREKNIMAQFYSPFIAELVASFQDDTCVYMMMNLLQGGELFSLIHSPYGDGLPEGHAKFYTACIAEGLSYLHRQRFVFRDLKPENVMIDSQGYAVIIDFGFCKKVDIKTYTMCGSPMYMSPEIILNCGHGCSTDHWSLGIVLFEMLVGHTPFFQRGMRKSELFRSILQAKIFPPQNVSTEALQFLAGLLKRDPAKRLGSLAEGDDGILRHEWFQEIDFELLFAKELKAPFLPELKNSLDVTNFDSWESERDKTRIKYPELTSEQKAYFVDF